MATVATETIQPIGWQGGLDDGVVRMLDQRLLPGKEVWNEYRTSGEVADAIRSMVIRGAPAIGIAAAMGMVLGAREQETDDYDAFVDGLEQVSATLAETRPTAVNLFWALDRMNALVESMSDQPVDAIRAAMLEEARAVQHEDIAMNRAMGQHGAGLMPEGARILTHCNTGSLATGGYGTALGVIRACHERARGGGSRDIHVWIDETRPYLQGARLTAWECVKEDIPSTLITDSMAGFFMQNGEVDAVITGADRIVANGDAANKIGTYSLAVLAKHHGIPFYVAAPTSTIDMATPDGSGIEIEERSADELRNVGDTSIAPDETPVRHPAFDVTPNDLITAIVTEKGVARPPYTESLASMMEET